MHNITSDQRAIPDLSYTCKWLSSLFPGKIFISVHFSGSQSLRKKNLILRFPVNLTSGIYFCLCWWKWTYIKRQWAIIAGILLSLWSAQKVSGVFWVWLWKCFRTSLHAGNDTFLMLTFGIAHACFIVNCTFPFLPCCTKDPYTNHMEL